MKSTAQLEKAVLSLPPGDRAHLALVAWESLEADGELAADPRFDTEGLALARARDQEIESGSSKPLTHEEFRRLTSSDKK
jgi:hypothetical protein